MDRSRFEQLVEEALDELPEEFAARLENVEVVVEDEPAPDLLREMELDPRRDTLFGLYQGVPLSDRGAGYGMVLPDRITIFYRPLVRTYHTPGAIRRQIKKTVVHEVGHFFGLDDDEIRAAGY
ncbi:MAG: metallopeptidase family protein [Deltaproteobacteria bacterium]|nr:metallopeptidase family protein [Deltaproteobacteria bacterium]